jgi:DNA-binding response OmpR family regulator
MTYKLLVVDDEVDIVEALKKHLFHEGYEVVVAFDGEEALEKMKSDNPDIVILDLMLPKLNGFEVLERIRKNYNDRWRPVIILSVKGDLESVREGYNLEADLYLTKPCSMENVLRGIKTMISLIPQRKTD